MVKNVHHHGHEREDDRAGHGEEHHQGDQDDQPEHDRQVRLEAVLERLEGGGLSYDGDLPWAVQRLKGVHRSLRGRRQGRRRQGDVGLPQGAAQVLERRGRP